MTYQELYHLLDKLYAQAPNLVEAIKASAKPSSYVLDSWMYLRFYVTPEIADELVAINDPNNRGVSGVKLKAIKKAKKSNEFFNLGEPTVITCGGSLGFGQHRAISAVQDRIGYETNLIIGIPDDRVFELGNKGSATTLTDRLVHLGFPKNISRKVAGTVRNWHKIHEAHCYDDDYIANFASKHRELLIESIEVGIQVDNAIGTRSTLAAGVYATGVSIDREKTINAFATLLNLSIKREKESTDPALALRSRWIVDAKHKQQTDEETLFLG